MSFIKHTLGNAYAPGWFLAHDECIRETRQMIAEGVSPDSEGGKHIPMGTIYPSNDANAIGIVYEDVDVTYGDAPGSVVTKGVVYEDRLPVELITAAKNALIAKGFTFVADSSVTRP